MSLVTFSFPKEYGYVVLTTVSTYFVGIWQGLRAANYRGQAKVRVPKVYCDSADMSAADPATKKAMHIYNCAQRSHANFMENQPSVMTALLISGLRYPILTAGLGASWTVGRIIYAIGYTNAEAEHGKRRMPGFAIGFLTQMGLYGLAAWTGIQMLL